MSTASITTGNDAFRFAWDLSADRAELRNASGELIWSGSLLPLFWLQVGTDQPRAVKATLSSAPVSGAPSQLSLSLMIDDLGEAALDVELHPHAVQFRRLQLNWRQRGVRVRALYFGAGVFTAEQRAGAPQLDLPFWPDWRAEGFCVASAKTNPIQSFFRSWDFGHTNIPLGSFGPAMGTPYAAAYPRPIYAAALGGRHGWVCLGSGSVPDAALTLKVQARSGALEWLYREDLWNPSDCATREWNDPLWLAWGDRGWTAYRNYFRLFPKNTPKNATHQKSFWGTWGDFRQNRYTVRDAVDRAVDVMEADLICIDDPWEEHKGSARPDPVRFPTLANDLEYAHERKLGVGLWLPMGWVANPSAEGLTADDLLLSRDGVPVRSNWAIDPRDEAPGHFCLDPSTTGAQRFLRERTRRVLATYRPTLLKIDFGYGLPGPDACAPRDPAMRGERLAWTYAHLIADAARAIDPTLTILYYSIHPLWAAVQDQCSLDDLGDAGSHEAAGHGQWSIWAALAGERGMALLASSGYLWAADFDNLLNSAIVGAPGANLPSFLPDGSPLPVVNLSRRRALFRWHRTRTTWTPLWLDSSPGDLEQEPITRNWGRLETIEGTPQLTALALREPSSVARQAPELRGLTWSGRWIVLSLDDASLFAATSTVVIPISAGTIELPRDRPPASVKIVYAQHETLHTSWSWRNERVHLEVSEALWNGPLLGLLIS